MGSKAPSPVTAHVVISTALALSLGSTLLFMILLVGGTGLVIDIGLGVSLDLGTAGALWFDLGLCLGFFVQHSGMIRRSFQAGLARWVDPIWHRALYAIVSGIALTALVLLWQPAPPVLLSLSGPWRWLARLGLLPVVAGLAWASRTFSGADLLGVAEIRRRMTGEEPPLKPVVIEGAYGWVRHPMYLLMLGFIWVHPDLTADRLLLSLALTCWIVVGTVLEERDLVVELGDDYRRYQQQVPMLIPFRRPPGITAR